MLLAPVLYNNTSLWIAIRLSESTSSKAFKIFVEVKLKIKRYYWILMGSKDNSQRFVGLQFEKYYKMCNLYIHIDTIYLA